MKPAEFFARFQANSLSPLYCFTGEDGYLQDLAVQILERQCGFTSRDEVNYEVHYGASTSLAAVIDSARTLPFLGPRKFVLVREADRIRKARFKTLLPYCIKPNSRTVLVFTGKNCPFPADVSRAFQEHGVILALSINPRGADTPAWIQYLAREEGKSIGSDASALLQELIGNNLQELSQAVEKLALYAGERPAISRMDVEETISRLRADSIFELTDHLGMGRRDRALVILHRLLESGEAPLFILTMIARHFRSILKAQILLEQGMSADEICRSLSIKSFVWSKILPQTKTFSRARVRGFFQRFWETDRSLKLQQISGAVILEQLVFDLCQEK